MQLILRHFKPFPEIMMSISIQDRVHSWMKLGQLYNRYTIDIIFLGNMMHGLQGLGSKLTIKFSYILQLRLWLVGSLVIVQHMYLYHFVASIPRFFNFLANKFLSSKTRNLSAANKDYGIWSNSFLYSFIIFPLCDKIYQHTSRSFSSSNMFYFQSQKEEIGNAKSRQNLIQYRCKVLISFSHIYLGYT